MSGVEKIISGGQTGADQGALDAALASDFPHGGSVPAGRKTEAGPLPHQYRLEELTSSHYPDRTAKNVRDGDGTVIVSHGELTGGSALTRDIAERMGKPWLHIDCAATSSEEALESLRSWCLAHRVKILNVAGPRASSDPLIYAKTRQLISALLHEGKRRPHGSL